MNAVCESRHSRPCGAWLWGQPAVCHLWSCCWWVWAGEHLLLLLLQLLLQGYCWLCGHCSSAAWRCLLQLVLLPSEERTATNNTSSSSSSVSDHQPMIHAV